MTAAATLHSLAVAIIGFIVGLMLAAVAIPAAAFAQDGPVQPPPTKTRSVIVYGDAPCPQSGGDEIVVCAREPASDQYRIPKRFRGRKAAASPAGNSWANKAEATEDASRMAAGLPNTCSAVGSGGQTGCFQQFQTQAARERQDDRRHASDIP